MAWKSMRLMVRIYLAKQHNICGVQIVLDLGGMMKDMWYISGLTVGMSRTERLMNAIGIIIR